MDDVPPIINQATAQKKFSCPSCGGESQWNPAKQALVCPFCGTNAPGTLQIGADGDQVVVEHDLVAAMRGIPDEARGWQAQKTSVRCQHCQAISIFDSARVGQRCDFCGSSALVAYEEIKEAFRPESLLQMRVSEPQVRESIRSWYGSRWFAPNRLKSAALTDTVKGLYIPYWTFDAAVHGDWTAESGYHYWETEYYTDGQGNRQSRQVQRTRWEPSAGSVDHFFDDELVAATRGVDLELLHRVEPFPTKEVSPYDAAFLSGWVVERYQIDLLAAAQQSRGQMERQMYSLCSSEVPGDTHRNLQVNCRYSSQTFKHVLVPIWLLTYHYGARHYQVVVNGYTGAIAGRFPKSWVKILFAVLGGLALALILAGLLSARLR